jgi:hypothetical protein
VRAIESTGAAFYSVSGRDFFPGVVALVNSLRLHGHDDPIFVLDCGLDPDQRALLAREANIVPASEDSPPSLQKLVAPLAHPAEVMVLLDADVIVTRPLGELIASSREGRLVAFENESHRYFAEWGELLGIGPVRESPYLMSSALLFSHGVAERVMSLAAEKQAALQLGPTWLGDGAAAGQAEPFFYADQDVLNAVVGARLEPEEVVACEGRLSAIPPFAGLRIADSARLRCEYADGARPYLLHHFFRKPWLSRMRSNVYSRLLTRLLCGPDVALRPGPETLPLRLRRGAAAALARTTVDLGVGGPAALRRRFGGGPERIAAWPNARPSRGPRR